jgi:hypothetical protein
MELTKKIKNFIEVQNWIFAKTYAKKWPHEYIVQERVEKKMFLELANHIDKFGYESYFYKMRQIYYDYNGYTYWHMGNIINRCLEEDTYSRRKIAKRLPEDKRK